MLFLFAVRTVNWLTTLKQEDPARKSLPECDLLHECRDLTDCFTRDTVRRLICFVFSGMMVF